MRVLWPRREAEGFRKTILPLSWTLPVASDFAEAMSLLVGRALLVCVLSQFSTLPLRSLLVLPRAISSGAKMALSKMRGGSGLAVVLAAAAAEGGTVVSDGAKLKSRKRGMLNTGLVTHAGVIFLQQSDATGKTKDGEFVGDCLSPGEPIYGYYDKPSKPRDYPIPLNGAPRAPASADAYDFFAFAHR